MPISLSADIHCHLLPAWDDGPPSIGESLLLATRLAQSGVQSIFVTPHVDREEVTRPERHAFQIKLAVQELRGQTRGAGLAVELIEGAEVMLSPGLPERLPDQPWLCLGSSASSIEPAQARFMLVELGPGAPWTPEVDALLFQVALQQVTPILAHPERYADIQHDRSIARALAGRGVLLQISAPSLLSSRGATASTARALLQEGLASFVASDAHSSKGVVLEQACAQVEALLGEQGARQVLVENPRRLAQGQPIAVAPRAPTPAPSLLSRLFRRA